ncbi:MAG: DUF2520 domain-containing protein [Actinobacteria bacterium]|nr:MAG: DUF2520 domain-containing protein [Actinomycetota bacterium]
MHKGNYSVSIIGAGKVGTAMGLLLAKSGYSIKGVSCRTEPHAVAVARRLSARAANGPAEAASLGDLILVTTPDDAVARVVADIAAAGGFSTGDVVFHMSGVLPVEVLEPARKAGAEVGCIHPMQSFADVEGAIEQLQGSVFGVTAAGRARVVALEVVEAVGGEAIDIEDRQKTLYHAAACVVSNYLVTLADYAEEIYRAIEVEPVAARRAYAPLIRGTAKNLLEKGPAEALTGPIVRGDVETVRAHLKKLTDSGIDTSVYRLLGARTVALAQRRGALAHETADKLLALLYGDEETSLSEPFSEELLPE